MSADADWVVSMPQTYDRCLGPALFAPYAELVASTAAALEPRRIVELAAGTGIATAELVRQIPLAHVTATDLNDAMVAWGASRVPGATWQQADAQHLDFPGESFDLVVCQFGVMFFPDKPAAFAEAARVMTAEARMVFTVWDTVATSDFPAALIASLAAVLPDDAPDFLTRVPHGYADPEQIRRDLHAGGLLVERMDRHVLRGHTDSADSLTRGFCLGTPLRFALEQRGPLDALTKQLTGQMRSRLGPGPLTGDLAAFLVTARGAPS
jgi:SAM-dependent methyltransferase